ncbi:MAG: hypothetical protein KBC35_02245 [Candidatus Pacebacteria bacterium]|jgi:hypothetical protein|nr:hypothetical protein [Candidatus Paceibacterota bacterium]
MLLFRACGQAYNNYVLFHRFRIFEENYMVLNIVVVLWVFSLLTNCYGVYRLWEYGPFNTNLVWQFVVRFTSPLFIVFGGAAGLVFAIDGNAHPILFGVMGLLSGFVISYLVQLFAIQAITFPYRKRKRIEKEYGIAFDKARKKLIDIGQYPRRPRFNSSVEEWETYNRAVEQLRSEGKLPPVPKEML